jgi:hypothetical protein
VAEHKADPAAIKTNTALTSASIVVGLAAQSVLGNLLSGIMLLNAVDGSISELQKDRQKLDQRLHETSPN